MKNKKKTLNSLNLKKKKKISSFNCIIIVVLLGGFIYILLYENERGYR